MPQRHGAPLAGRQYNLEDGREIKTAQLGPAAHLVDAIKPIVSPDLAPQVDGFKEIWIPESKQVAEAGN